MRSAPVSSIVRAWLVKIDLAIAVGFVSSLAFAKPTGPGVRASMTAPPAIAAKPSAPKAAMTRWPRRVSYVESAASTPIIMSTKRNIMRIAPVYTAIWTTPMNGASSAVYRTAKHTMSAMTQTAE